MTARKTPKKAAPKKKPAARPASKASASAPKRPAPSKAKLKAAAKPKREAAAKPKREAAAKPKREAAAKPKREAAAKPKREAKVSSLAVNRGHLFALRPRVSTAFRPEDFLAARRLLEDEGFESIEAAARAVAERALALCNEPKTKRDFRPGR